MKRGVAPPLTLIDKKRLFVVQHALTTVYFMAAPDANMVKIGKTIDLPRRFSCIQTMSPVPLVLACHMDYDAELEARIHKHFKKLRSHGEWFHAEKELVDFMRNYKRHGLRWVVETVGDAPRHWMNKRGMLDQNMRDALDDLRRKDDPDGPPNTQNKSGVDFALC